MKTNTVYSAEGCIQTFLMALTQNVFLGQVPRPPLSNGMPLAKDRIYFDSLSQMCIMQKYSISVPTIHSSCLLYFYLVPAH